MVTCAQEGTEPKCLTNEKEAPCEPSLPTKPPESSAINLPPLKLYGAAAQRYYLVTSCLDFAGPSGAVSKRFRRKFGGMAWYYRVARTWSRAGSMAPGRSMR